MGSPFDYRAHALLYVARHLPDRRAAGAEEAIHEELARLIGAAGGRTLALFTSRRATEAAAEALADELPCASASGRPTQGPAARGVRRRRDLVPVRHHGVLARRGRPGPSAVPRDHRPAALPSPDDPCSRPAATAPAVRLLGRRPAPGGHVARPGRGETHPHGGDRGVVAVLDPRLATASYRGCSSPPAAHASQRGLRRGGVVPAPRARWRPPSDRRRAGRLGRPGPYSANSNTRLPSAPRRPSVATRMTQRPATRRSWSRSSR